MAFEGKAINHGCVTRRKLWREAESAVQIASAVAFDYRHGVAAIGAKFFDPFQTAATAAVVKNSSLRW